MSTDLGREGLRRLLADAVLSPDFRRATFGGAVRGPAPSPWVRVVVRPVDLRDGPHLQFSDFDGKKDVTKNCRGDEVGPRLDELLAAGFAAVHLSTAAEEVDVRTTKKGKLLVGRRPA